MFTLQLRWSLRQFTPSHPHTYRAFNTSVVSHEKTHPFPLPPAKLRALITLYHRSSSFITPANLSRRIDQAFADSCSSTSSGIYYLGYKELKTRLKRNREPSGSSLLYRNVSLNEFGSAPWSGMRGKRQALVSAALWGIQFDGKPSLETVQETRATNEKLGSLLDQTGDAPKL